MVRQHHRLSGHEFEQSLRDSGEQSSLASCSPWGHRSNMTSQLNSNAYLENIKLPFPPFPLRLPSYCATTHPLISLSPHFFRSLPQITLGWTNYLSLQTRILLRIKFNSVQFLSPVRLFVTPWTTSHQASLSITNSWSSLTLMTLELVMPSNLLIPCHPLLPPSSFPTSGSFPMSHFFASDGQSFGASILASVLPMNIQD